MSPRPKAKARRRTRPVRPTRGQFRGRRFASEAEYRRALARARAGGIRTIRDATRLSDSEQGIWYRALRVLANMRTHRRSLTAASAEQGLSRDQALRFIRGAVTKDRRGRYRATARDRLLRPLEMLTPRGRVRVDVTDSRTASTIAAYWNAVDEYLRTGSTRALAPFRRQSVRVGKLTYRFVTDPLTLQRLALREDVRFEDIYAHVE